jgi:rare lipoprotein A
MASWYGRKFHGKRTSSGEVYDMYAMTAAHKTLPLPTYVKVRNLESGAEIVVRVNDRGPFLGGRLIDLSYMAARKLDVVATGTGRVEVMTVTPRTASVPVQEIVVSGEQVDSVFLQAGSFRLRGNAEALRHQLADNGLAGITLTKTWVGDTLYYRVRVGPLSRGKAVDQGLERIRTITGVEPRIVEVRH